MTKSQIRANSASFVIRISFVILTFVIRHFADIALLRQALIRTGRTTALIESGFGETRALRFARRYFSWGKRLRERQILLNYDSMMEPDAGFFLNRRPVWQTKIAR